MYTRDQKLAQYEKKSALLSDSVVIFAQLESYR